MIWTPTRFVPHGARRSFTVSESIPNHNIQIPVYFQNPDVHF